MTFETPITFLTIENNNIKIYIVTLEFRMTGTAFAILGMFLHRRRLYLGNIRYAEAASYASMAIGPSKSEQFQLSAAAAACRLPC